MVNPTPVPSNMPKAQPAQTVGTPQLPNTAVPGPRIKAEPGTESYQVPQYSGFEPNYNNNEAYQRAEALIRQKHGGGADPHIQQLQRQPGDPHQAHRPAAHPGNIQLPPQLSEQQRREYIERQRQQQFHQMRQSQQAQQRPAVGNAQTDGATEWATLVAQHRADELANPNATYEADMTFRELSKQASRAMEGGGVMEPLSERSDLSQLKKRKVGNAAAVGPLTSSLAASQLQNPNRNVNIAQLDGLDSDEETKSGIKPVESELEDDEDAINSDLDDPNDNPIGEDRDDEDETEIMACTYDKVARVKNKWKCTLKDGILNTGGRE